MSLVICNPPYHYARIRNHQPRSLLYAAQVRGRLAPLRDGAALATVIAVKPRGWYIVQHCGLPGPNEFNRGCTMNCVKGVK